MDPEDTELQGGGDPACWIHLVCPECGALKTEGHREGCSLENPDDSLTDPITPGQATR